MAAIRIDIREDDGSSSIAEVRTATPEHLEATREIVIAMTRLLATSKPAA